MIGLRPNKHFKTTPREQTQLPYTGRTQNQRKSYPQCPRFRPHLQYPQSRWKPGLDLYRTCAETVDILILTTHHTVLALILSSASAIHRPSLSRKDTSKQRPTGEENCTRGRAPRLAITHDTWCHWRWWWLRHRALLPNPRCLISQKPSPPYP